ncbi:MAG: polyamine aminopropyltransferase [Candidatus Sungiibacteriota bacterium]|uniref:Polyamine aminopropyltransferase n=1 Tax=Candidatus Sungiibacteriota bacterium TaxID=2750080 RepID=A0A7T5UPU9_9BACT|nr:MAG: polyamine aminopropyltransferase [Candidatus Sungbacteria bacterium]
MPLVKQHGRTWFRETLFPDIAQSFAVNRVLHEEITTDANGCTIHVLLVLETPRLGRVLILDGVVQTTERDEYLYHEPLVHCAAHSLLKPPQRVLLIGCDGGTLREVVKYQSVEKIEVVDIDKRVIELTKEYMPFLAQGAFDDQRVELTIMDGAEFVKSKRQEAVKYDLIIVDSPDPIGPARSLFTTPFYLDVASILANDGIVIRQTGVTMYQPEEMLAHVVQMLEVFPEGDVQIFMTAVPTYIGGYFTFVAASPRKGIFKEAPSLLDERCAIFPTGTFRWFSPQMHRAAMAVPPTIQQAVEQSEYGRELILNLYGCDHDALTNRNKWKEYLHQLCCEIEMKQYGAPIITPDFGLGKSHTAGLSAVQFIETSSITMHASPHWRRMNINIFTCSSLDADRAVNLSMRFFGAKSAKWKVEIRCDMLPRLEDEIVLCTTQRSDDHLMTEKYLYRRQPEKIDSATV